ncbi:MAG: hypothetical protein LBT02_00920 [Rickettsiales bacterium]|jgi:hypothetical protein|nr:hypothetical protein [Rickettsiales bacterium]
MSNDLSEIEKKQIVRARQKQLNKYYEEAKQEKIDKEWENSNLFYGGKMIKNIYIILLVLLMLTSCGTIKNGFSAGNRRVEIMKVKDYTDVETDYYLENNEGINVKLELNQLVEIETDRYDKKIILVSVPKKANNGFVAKNTIKPKKSWCWWSGGLSGFVDFLVGACDEAPIRIMVGNIYLYTLEWDD